MGKNLSAETKKLLSDEIKDDLSYEFLSKKFEALLKRLKQKDSLEYKKIHDNLVRMLDKGDTIVVNFKNINNLLQISSLYNIALDIMSPTSNAMGFKFIDVMSNLAVKILLRDMKEEEKPKAKGFLKRLFNSPIVDTVLKITPIGNFVSNVINTIKSKTNSVLNHPKFNDIKKAIKDGKSDAEYKFEMNKINEFEEALEVYIKFYQKFDEINNSNLENHLRIKKELDEIRPLANGFYKNLKECLKLNNKEEERNLNDVMPYEIPDNYETLLDYLESEDIKKANEMLEEFTFLNNRIKTCQDQYKKYFNSYKSDMTNLLNDFEEQNSEAKKEKIEQLVKRINEIEVNFN